MTLVSIPANPVPEGAVTGTLKTPDGVTLRFARWDPPPGRKGTVVIAMGRTEFIEKYFEMVRELRGRGFAVAIVDWRGQGRSQRLQSDPFKGHVGSFAEYQTDLETLMNEIVLPDCPPPLFALGHSMGSTVLIQTAAKGHRWFDRMVLSTPMLDLIQAPRRSYRPLVVRTLRYTGTGSAYVPKGDATVLAREPFAVNRATSDPVRYARAQAVLEADPSLGLGSPTVSWLHAAYRAMAELNDRYYPGKIRQPMLIVAAGRDLLVSTPAIEHFAIHLRAGSHQIVPGAMHELMMERDQYRAQFLAAFDAFVPGTPLFG
jgi:lysophospholipase